MQMTSAVIADYHGNIYGRYKVRAQKKKERKIERRRGGGRRKK